MTFEVYARGWLERQTKYAPGTIAFYRRSLETVFPEIGAIKLNRLRPIALENLLAKLRKRTYRGKSIKEKTVQKYLTVVSAVLSDAKRNEIIEKNPARMIDLPGAECKTQEIPTMEEMQKFLSALCYEEPVFQLFYFLAINTGMRRGELCALRWSDVIVTGSYEGYIIVQHSRSTVSGEGVQEGKTKNGRARTVSMNEEMFSLLRGFCYRKMRLRDERGIPFPEYIFTKDDGTPIHPDTFSKHLKALFAEIGLPKTYHLHTLRHFFVSTLLHEGVDKNTVADLAGHGDSRLDLAVGQSRQQRCSHGNTGGGAVLGHRSLWEMDVDVLGLIKVRVDPQRFRPAPQAGQSSLGGLLHHVAQITGQLQLAGALHDIDLDL